MQTQGLVSIVMAAFNAERFIAQSIQSVIAQTYTDWELLIVDDASTDNTEFIVREFATRDQRIRLIVMDSNVGPARARNSAIQQATGRFIAFLDSDDLWLPQKLEIQVSRMIESKVGLSFTAYKKIDAEGQIGKTVIEVPKTVTYPELLNSNVIGCLTAVIDTTLVGKIFMPEIDLRQDYGLWLRILKRPGHEDYSLWLQLLRDTARQQTFPKALGINDVLALYRVHDGTISRNKLKAAMYQWMVYRSHERLSLMRTLYHFLNYAYHGFRKHLR